MLIRFWDILNKPVSLLLLSSVLISGLGKLYGDYTAGNARVASDRNERNAIGSEMVLRNQEIENVIAEADKHYAFSTLLGRISKLSKCRRLAADESFVPGKRYVDLKMSNDQLVFIRAIVYGNPPYSPSDQEFKGISLPGLMLRLDRLSNSTLAVVRWKPAVHRLALPGTGDTISYLEAVEAIPHMTDACFVAVGLNFLTRYQLEHRKEIAASNR